MPEEGKLRLHPTEQTAETELHAPSWYQREATESLLFPLSPELLRYATAIWRGTGAHRRQTETGIASRSRPEQAAGRVILKVTRQPVQRAVRYSELILVTKAAWTPLEQGHQSLVQDIGVADSRGSISQGTEA